MNTRIKKRIFTFLLSGISLAWASDANNHMNPLTQAFVPQPSAQAFTNIGGSNTDEDKDEQAYKRLMTELNKLLDEEENTDQTGTDDKSQIHQYIRELNRLGENGDVNLRAEILISLGKVLYAGASNAHEYSEKLNSFIKEEESTNQIQIDVSNIKKRDYQIGCHLRALDLLGENGNVNLRAQALISLENARYDANMPNSFFNNHLKALNILGENGDIHLRAQALIGLGNARYHGNIPNSHFNNYQTALNLLGENGDINLRAQALIGLGNAKCNNIQIPYYQNALNILGDNGDINLRAQALIGLGNVRGDKKDEEHEKKRPEFYKNALDLLGKNGNIRLRAHAFKGLGCIAMYTNQALEGFKYYIQAYNLYRTIDEKNLIKMHIMKNENRIRGAIRNISDPNKDSLNILHQLNLFIPPPPDTIALSPRPDTIALPPPPYRHTIPLPPRPQVIPLIKIGEAPKEPRGFCPIG